MKLSFAILLTVLSVSSVMEAKTFARRQVPQEHSHEALIVAMRLIVPTDTPSIQGDGNLPDVVFGLLGNGVAGQNSPTKGDEGAICLQQDTADTAISLAAGDNTKIATALKYRALERNSGGVGVKSDLCTKTPVNAILEGLTQHQDAASEGAAEFNKNVEVTLAGKLASLGVDPLEALETATFGPGDTNDSTGAGLSCNDDTDPAGCIFTNNLNVPAATEEELLAAGAGGGAQATAANDPADADPADADPADADPADADPADADPAAGGDADAIIDNMLAELEQLKVLCAAAA